MPVNLAVSSKASSAEAPASTQGCPVWVWMKRLKDSY